MPLTLRRLMSRLPATEMPRRPALAGGNGRGELPKDATACVAISYIRISFTGHDLIVLDLKAMLRVAALL